MAKMDTFGATKKDTREDICECFDCAIQWDGLQAKKLMATEKRCPDCKGKLYWTLSQEEYLD